MLKKIKYLIVGVMFVVCGAFLFFGKEYKTYSIKKKEKIGVACYLNQEYDNSDYIAVLEIPCIDLTRGLTNDTNVDNNITFVESSNMPNIVGGTTIIAGHSGSGDNAYFDDLDKLKLNDKIYLYYYSNKYEYVITEIYEIEKTGKLSLKKKNENRLVLITCKKNTNKQIVIISKLLTKKETT